MELSLLSFFIIVLILIMEQAAFLQVPHLQKSLIMQLSAKAQHREKRCSCENLKDRECVYFCHIGIVWINTPSQVTPYGVGSLRMRPRRDVRRCLCTKKSDTDCQTFCSYWYSQGKIFLPQNMQRVYKEIYKATVKKRKNSATHKT